MMAPKLRFSCGLKAKAPGAVTCTALVPALTSRSKFLQAQCPSTEHKKQRWWRWGFFFFNLRGSFMYDCYFTNVLTQRSCFEVLLTADSQCFTRDDARIFVPTIPRRRRPLTVSWNTEVFAHCEKCGQCFLTRCPRHQFPLPANLHRHSRRPRFQQDETSSLLDRRRLESIQTYSSYTLVSHPQRCFPPFGQKPREA